VLGKGVAALADAVDSDDAAHILPLVFDWREYIGRAPRAIADSLAASEAAAAAFCGKVNASEAFRCNRSAHTRDWGPEPHWVAVVELLLLAVVTDVVVGAGYPYFKVCNTFAQIGAALADAAPEWLCALGPTRRRAQQASRRCGAGAGVSAGGRAGRAGGDRVEPHRIQLLCASQLFSTDWGSSMWRSLNGTAKRGSDTVVDCGSPICMPTPLHPELWSDLRDDTCAADDDTGAPPNLLFGIPIKPLRGYQ
jgi:hypothetical protein